MWRKCCDGKRHIHHLPFIVYRLLRYSKVVGSEGDNGITLTSTSNSNDVDVDDDDDGDVDNDSSVDGGDDDDGNILLPLPGADG